MVEEKITFSGAGMEKAYRRIRILLAEDNDDDVLIIREVFQKARLVNIVDVVTDGQEALAYLRQEGPYQDRPRPDLLLLDINMPKKNGIQVLQEIKKDPKLRSLPVLMLTSSERKEDILRSYDQGACTYIVKPMTYQSFLDVAQTLSFYWGLYARVPSELEENADEGGSYGRE